MTMAYFSGKQEGLVVASLYQTIPVKGNRHQCIVMMEVKVERTPFHESHQRLGKIRLVLILEGMNRLLYGPRKRIDGSCRIIGDDLC